MRTYKFKGKTKNYGTWVKGSLDVKDDKCYIKEINERGVAQRSRVLNETVGQFTGLLDKAGEEIYEGDYVTIDRYESCGLFLITWDDLQCRYMLDSKDLSVELDSAWAESCTIVKKEVVND